MMKYIEASYKVLSDEEEIDNIEEKALIRTSIEQFEIL